MSKKNKLLKKLIEASGGWENFLYETLKEVCTKVGKKGFTGEGEDAVEDAMEILEAYEEIGKKERQPNQIVSTPQVQKVVKDVSKVEDSSESTEPEKDETEDDEDELSELELVPVPRPTPKSRKMDIRIPVDKDAGGSQGELPIPAVHRIINRQYLTVTTGSGVELGRGSEDGQVNGHGVSGHVATNGQFRLAFKDVSLGVGVVHFEVIPLPSKMTKMQFEKAVATRNDLTVKKLHKRLQELDKVVVPCGCGLALCFGWEIKDQSEIDKAAAVRKEKVAAMFGSSMVRGRTS